MRKLIRKLLKLSWGLPPDPHTTYCPSPESDESLRKNWLQAIGHRLSAISGFYLIIDKGYFTFIRTSVIIRYIGNRFKLQKMLFLSDDKSKSEIIKIGEETILKRKYFLENCLLINDFQAKNREIVRFTEKLAKNSKNLILKEDIKLLCEGSKNLINLTESFKNQNLEFFDTIFFDTVDEILYMTIGVALILYGIRKVEQSHKIRQKVNSTKITYEGVDKIAKSIEKYIQFFPKEIILDVKNIVKNICTNTQKIQNNNLEIFEKEEKGSLKSNLIEIKRTCISTISLIDKHITKIEEEGDIKSLFINHDAYNFIQRQEKLFKKIDKEILEKYEGKFVYVEDGEILDSDLVEENLIQRVMEKVGYRDVLITKVNCETNHQSKKGNNS